MNVAKSRSHKQNQQLLKDDLIPLTPDLWTLTGEQTLINLTDSMLTKISRQPIRLHFRTNSNSGINNQTGVLMNPVLTPIVGSTCHPGRFGSAPLSNHQEINVFSQAEAAASGSVSAAPSDRSDLAARGQISPQDSFVVERVGVERLHFVFLLFLACFSALTLAVYPRFIQHRSVVLCYKNKHRSD